MVERGRCGPEGGEGMGRRMGKQKSGELR